MKQTRATVDILCDFCLSSKRKPATARCACGNDVCDKHCAGIVLPVLDAEKDLFFAAMSALLLRGRADVYICMECMSRPLMDIVMDALAMKHGVAPPKRKKTVA